MIGEEYNEIREMAAKFADSEVALYQIKLIKIKKSHKS